MLRLRFQKRPETDIDERAIDMLVEAWKRETRGNRDEWRPAITAVIQSSVGQAVTERVGTERGRMALALLRRATATWGRNSHHPEYWFWEALKKLAYGLITGQDAVSLETYPDLVREWQKHPTYGETFAPFIDIAEVLVEAHGMTPQIEATLRNLMEKLETPPEWQTSGAEMRRSALQIRHMLDPEGIAGLGLPEPWQAPFRELRWKALLHHAAAARGTAPSERWTKAARPHLDAADEASFLDAFEGAVDAIRGMDVLIDTIHADMLRGLAWTAGLVGTPRAAALLGRLVVASAHKLPGFGARSTKGFTGAVGALERMGSFASLAELSNARNRVKTASLSAALDAALTRAALRQNLSVEELEELVVPTYDLELPGLRWESIGGVEATLEIVGATDVEIRWTRAGGPLKSAPLEAKALDKSLKAAKKEIETTLAAQRSRLEGMMLSGRTLPYFAWRERYLDHPLLSFMARRLVWRFASPLPSEGKGPGVEGQSPQPFETLGIAPNGIPVDVEGRTLEGLGEATTVRLWHPIQAGAAAIETWRDFLVVREIRQPFKQGYREIYLLTAAEERTNTYSNRFAAHILKQHQMAALARGRGWRYTLQGGFDGHNAPTFDLPQWNLQAEYAVDVADMGAMPDGGMTESGIALYVVTDRVTFLDRGSHQPVPLVEIPPTVFSEAMRDVDLFVGVASVGNDANWIDQGERTGYGAYWRQVSFGDLSATAETRKAVLERLLPRLAVGKVARIDGRFLVVKGKRRTYKIHLGSGNILMEPNDQYLCIVPSSAKGAGDRVYLPFEGDGVLAIILSKAAMLADDDRITDPTILRQL